MAQEPYRQDPLPQNDELARMAQEGRRRLNAAAAQGAHVQEIGARHLRTAIGSVRGSPIKRVMLGVIFVGFVTAAVGLVLGAGQNDSTFVPLIPIGFVIAFVTFMVFLFVPPLATRGQIDAERARVGALPFQLQGYFETLSGEPEWTCPLRIDLVWQGPSVDDATVQGVAALHDIGARVAGSDGTTTTIVTSPISGATGIRINNVPVYRNHKMAKYLVKLVDVVLVPLHRNRGLARVVVARAR